MKPQAIDVDSEAERLERGIKKCPTPNCNTLHSHPTRDECTRCSGWCCLHCGRCKTPEQVTCGRSKCKELQTKQEKKQQDKQVSAAPKKIASIRRIG